MTGQRRLVGDDEQVSVTSVAGHQRDGERQVEVTSYRPGTAPAGEARRNAARQAGLPGEELGEEVRALSGDGGDGLHWAKIPVVVDGVTTHFSLTGTAERWAAVGETPLAVIAIAARNLPWVGLALVRQPDPPPPMRHRQRPPRSRRFPDEHLSSTLNEAANVDLVYTDKRLTGSYNGAAIDLAIDVPHSHSRASGRLAGVDMSATWRLGDNSAQPHLDGALHGRFAAKVITLRGDFHLDDDYAIANAEIEGRIGDAPIAAEVEAIDGGLSTTGTVAIDGTFAGIVCHLVATISADLSRGLVSGTVDGTTVRLAAETSRRTNEPTTVTGNYQGPLPLLALIVGTLLYFT